MAKTVHKSPTISGQLEPLLRAAALRRLEQEAARISPARVSNASKGAGAPKKSKASAKKRKKA